MQKGRFITALLVFLAIAVLIPVFANLLPDYTRTLARAGEIISRAYIDRVANYLVSGKKANIVVAGSSLVVFPHVLTDGYFEKVPVPVPDPIEYADFLTNYVEMAHFKKLLAASPGSHAGVDLEKMSVVDLGVPSLMLSDCDLLFEKLQKNQSLPHVALLFLAPRDFLDSTVTLENNLFLHEISGRITFRELLNSGSFEHLRNQIVNATAYSASAWAGQLRSGGKRIILALRKLGRKPKKETSTGALTHEQALHYFYFGNGKLSDLSLYKKRYNPPDRARIKEQIAALGRLLDRLKNNSVQTVVVEMPLTRENLDLLHGQARADIHEGMLSECAKRAVLFIPCHDLGAYDACDFLDSVHLNALGGDKLFRRLAPAIASVQ